MTNTQRERMVRYSFRKYDSLGPKSLSEARKKLCRKIMKATEINKAMFDSIIEDLVEQNKWPESMAMAYFECLNVEDRT